MSARQVSTKGLYELRWRTQDNTQSYLRSDSDDNQIKLVNVTDRGSTPHRVRVMMEGVPVFRVMDMGKDITIIGGDLFKQCHTINPFKLFGWFEAFSSEIDKKILFGPKVNISEKWIRIAPEMTFPPQMSVSGKRVKFSCKLFWPQDEPLWAVFSFSGVLKRFRLRSTKNSRLCQKGDYL